MIREVSIVSVLATLSAVAMAGDTTLVVTPGDCAAIVAHEAAPDVAYRAGVDARGGPVTPADLADSGGLDLDASEIAIAIEIPLRLVPGSAGDEARFLAQGGAIDRFAATAEVGRVTLRKGQVYFNGQRLDDSARHALAVECRARLDAAKTVK